MELWHCVCKRPGKATAQDCTRHQAETDAARQQANVPGPAELAAMRESIAAAIGLPIEFR